MAEHMGELVVHFGGKAGRVRCVLHITNFVEKSLMKSFDIPKKGSWESTEGEMERACKWATDDELGEDIHTMGEQRIGDTEDDNAEGWINEMELLSDDEQAKLEEDVCPLQRVLFKVGTKKKGWTYD